MQLCYSGGMLSFPACLFCSQHTSILPSLALRCAFVIGHNSSRVFHLSLSFDLKRLLESDLQNVTFNQTFHEYFFVRVRVQGQRLDDYFCAIIFFCSRKKVSTILIYTNRWCTGKCQGMGGWRKELMADLPAKTDAITARALCFSHSFTQSA